MSYFQRAIVTVVPSPGVDMIVEFVRQPLGAAQPQPEAAAGRVAVRQGQLDVGDARALVVKVSRSRAARRRAAISMRTLPPPP